MDKYLDKIVIAVIIDIGFLALEYKSRNPTEPSPPSTAFMRCMGLTENRAKIDCMEQEKLDISDYAEKDNEPRRK